MMSKRFGAVPILVIAAFLLNLLPIYVPPALAVDNTITIRNTYTNFARTSKLITLEDYDIFDYEDKELSLDEVSEGWQTVASPQEIGDDILQASLDKTWNLRAAMVNGTIGGINHKIQYNDINEDGIPEVTSIETPLVGVNDMIILNGPAELGVIGGTSFTIKVGGVTAAVDSVSPGGNQVTIKPKTSGSQFPVGTQNISITQKSLNLPSIEDGVPGGTYALEITGIYQNAVQIVGEIDLSGMTMFPTMGETGSTVEFRRSTLNNYDVYFIEDLNDPSLYTAANKVSDANYQWTPYADPEDDVVTIKVPAGLSPGPYWIVFTNANSQAQGITARYVFGYPDQQFTVVQLSQQPSISNVDPRESPSQTQTEVNISGYYFSKANIPGLTLATPPTMTFTPADGILDYGVGNLTIGSTDYRVSVKRDFEIVIGNILPFTGTGFSFDPADPNAVETFTINTIPFALDHEEIYDVTVRMTTTLTPAPLLPGDPEFTGTLVKEVSLADYYTYSAATEIPEVDDVSPAVIPIEDIGGHMYLNSSMDQLMIAIHGSNFLVTRYMDAGTEVIHYPKVTLGNTVINPNDDVLPTEYDPLEFTVLKGSDEVDGLPGNEIGDTIIMVLDAGSSGFEVLSPDSRNVKIQNPIRSSPVMSVDFNFDNVVQFLEISLNDFPVISSVTPNMVDVDGGEPVVIAGSNFRTGAVVTIDGKEVSGIQISGDNKEIKFNAPPGREGTTQLQVINPSDGGIATVPFTYTQGYSEPQLSSLDPDEGTTNTIVIASGSNFIKPDPTVSVTDPASIDEQSVVYRLIGSRILMDGHDINKYHYIGGEIQFQPYSEALSALTLTEPVFVHESDGQLSLGSGFNSVVFWDAAHSSFYRLTRDIRNNTLLDNGLGTSYTISYEGGNFVATMGGTDSTINQSNNGRLQFNGLTLDAYTAYEIENDGTYDRITGNRVQVRNSSSIQFNVPLLVNAPWTGEGLYDVTVENPDTRKATMTDAFLYYSSSRIVPMVSDVVPDQGPNSGENLVVLTSPDTGDPNTGFVDLGVSKTRVWIGTTEVAASAITISPNGKSMTVRMPAYDGDIKALGTDRLTVPINLVNPDGASFSINYDNPISVTRTAGSKKLRGYTYVIPSSHPTLTSLVPDSGDATGAIIVDIYGSDFRDFEPFTDANGNGRWDAGEPYTDLDGDGAYTAAAPRDAAHKTTSQYNHQTEVLTSVLLPQVYFGLAQAEIVDYNAGWLQVVIPPGTGSATVYVANNDSGISNKLQYTYVSSKPTIGSVSPNIGDKRGGTDVEIAGTEFQQGSINIMTDQTAPSGLNLINPQTMPLVKTGAVSNRSLPADDDNSGRIQSSVASVSLDGGLSARYNAGTTTLELSILDEGANFTRSYGWDGSQVVYINTQDLSNGGTSYPYQQLIKFEIANNRLLVEAGYAPDVTLNNSTNLSVQMPCYHTVDTVSLTVMNPDGGTASSSFTYTNPASHPVITNVMKDGKQPITVQEEVNGVLATIQEVKLTYKGGNIVAVLGTDFRENATIQIGTIATIEAADIAYDLPGKMSFTMPAVAESEIGKLQRVLVINEDGASAASDRCSPPIYVKFVKGETAPSITSVTPEAGPAAGNTPVTIIGSDFRDGLTVTFGGIPATNVVVVDYKTVTCLTPAHAPGEVEVKIENPDGELCDPNGKYTYVSNPIVTKVVDAADPTESQLVNTISINGGQIIKVKGSGFMDGARVVFAPKLTAVTDTTSTTTGLIYIDGLPYTLDAGTEGTDTLFIDEETLTVTTPAGTLDSSGLMVINPDNGASEVYGDITYTLPQIASPLNIVAELVHDSYYDTDRYIKVHWDAVKDATGYEIYVVADDQKEFIGTTTETSYLYKELEPKTRYKFVVTAVWDFSSSPPSAESNTVKTGDTVGNPDLDAGLNDKTTSSISGDVATIVIGTTDYKIAGNHTFDLTTGALAAAKKVVVVLPAYVISRTDAPDVEIIANDFNLTFNPAAFYVDAIKQDPDADDAGVRFTAGPYTSTISTDSTKTLCKPVILEAQVFKGQTSNKADTLVKNIQLGLDYDSSLLSARRLKNPSLYKYNATGKTWDTAAAWRNIDPFEMGRLNQMGTYAILGSR